MGQDGVLVMNLIGGLGEHSRALPAIINTLRTQFSDLAVYPLFTESGNGGAGGNFIVLARNGSLTGALALRRIDGVHPLAAAGVESALRQGRVPGATGNSLVLTDDFNPLDVLDTELHESVRKTILSTTPAVILLHG
jgi:hypothetical protein